MVALVYVGKMTTDIRIIQLQAGWWLGSGAMLGVTVELGQQSSMEKMGLSDVERAHSGHLVDLLPNFARLQGTLYP